MVAIVRNQLSSRSRARNGSYHLPRTGNAVLSQVHRAMVGRRESSCRVRTRCWISTSKIGFVSLMLCLIRSSREPTIVRYSNMWFSRSCAGFVVPSMLGVVSVYNSMKNTYAATNAQPQTNPHCPSNQFGNILSNPISERYS